MAFVVNAQVFWETGRLTQIVGIPACAEYGNLASCKAH